MFVKYLLCVGVTKLQRRSFHDVKRVTRIECADRLTITYWIWHKASIRRVVARDRPCERRRDKMPDIVPRVCINRLNGDAGNARITSYDQNIDLVVCTRKRKENASLFRWVRSPSDARKEEVREYMLISIVRS